MNTYKECLDRIISVTLDGGQPGKYTKCGDSDRHLATLFSLVLQTRAKNILELGVRYGDTTLPLTLGASLTKGKVDAVDIAPTEWTCPQFLTPYYEFHQSEALEFLSKVEKPYDIVYVDDWHSGDHVAKELEFIDTFTTNNSLIILHDLMGNQHEPNYYHPINVTSGEWAHGGPYDAVKKLPSDKWEFVTVPVNNGFTILRKI